MKVYNTPKHTTEDFMPQAKGKVSLYTCGPTVYSDLHIGNWVSFIRWDLLVRILRDEGYGVNRVMNITDVGHLTSDADEGEDKMQKGARSEGITEWEVAAKYTESFLAGMNQLNMTPPEHLVKATDHIAVQIALVKKLEDNGHTYVLDDGVYFDTNTFSRYADFAQLDLEAQKAGARVSYNDGKKNTSDFVLWRLTPQGQSRTMEWDSPWGRGIPGWHIECSAMAMHYLGETIDIHTGGIDHIPVHHTNEIAQSEAATGKQFVNFWLHNAHLLSDGTKLSKSLGNSYTLEDIATKGYSPNDLRMFVLQSHYRTESNFTWENLLGAKHRLNRWQSVASLRWQISSTPDTKSHEEHVFNSAYDKIRHALRDDMNTPEALRVVEESFDRIEAECLNNSLDTTEFATFLAWLDSIFGLQLEETTPDLTNEQKSLLQERLSARSQKDWVASDSIRDTLAQQNIIVKDTGSATHWYRSSP